MVGKEEFIARVRHLGWCCYQIAANQDYNIEPNEDQLESLKIGTEAGLKLMYETGEPLDPEKNHEIWMDTKVSQGWIYGKEKDLEKKTHPDLVPFDKLPKIEKDKDIMDSMMIQAANDLYELWFGENRFGSYEVNDESYMKDTRVDILKVNGHRDSINRFCTYLKDRLGIEIFWFYTNKSIMRAFIYTIKSDEEKFSKFIDENCWVLGRFMSHDPNHNSFLEFL